MILVKLGDLTVVKLKSFMNTVVGTDVGEKFPVKIDFSRPLNDSEMIRLAGYALLVERGIEQIETRNGDL